MNPRDEQTHCHYSLSRPLHHRGGASLCIPGSSSTVLIIITEAHDRHQQRGFFQAFFHCRMPDSWMFFHLLCIDWAHVLFSCRHPCKPCIYLVYPITWNRGSSTFQRPAFSAQPAKSHRRRPRHTNAPETPETDKRNYTRSHGPRAHAFSADPFTPKKLVLFSHRSRNCLGGRKGQSPLVDFGAPIRSGDHQPTPHGHGQGVSPHLVWYHPRELDHDCRNRQFLCRSRSCSLVLDSECRGKGTYKSRYSMYREIVCA